MYIEKITGSRCWFEAELFVVVLFMSLLGLPEVIGGLFLSSVLLRMTLIIVGIQESVVLTSSGV